MRLDRSITLNLVQPFSRASGPGHGIAEPVLPVLMWHSISDDPEPGVRPYYRICTNSARFREQMQWLKDNGYCGVTLSAGLAALKTQSENLQRPALQPRPVVLTFDDGFRNFHTAAWPILREFGFSATMYLPTRFIASAAASPSGVHRFNSRECLSWAEIKELHPAGIEFGSHTVSHPKLTELSWPEIESEIRESKSEIENHLGVHCPAFAYPYAWPRANGEFVARFSKLLTAHGYATCVTTQLG
ncbi:MAG: polysaccharide deacetylase family protein, partial [Limisphaerales bacterium]